MRGLPVITEPRWRAAAHRRARPRETTGMTTTEQPATGTAAETIDLGRLEAFVGRAIDEVGAALNCALVVMGDKLGYYRALAARGPLTPAELAEATGTDEHYAREWLNAQAAGAFVTHDPPSPRY